jgi:hypothetical protein
MLALYWLDPQTVFAKFLNDFGHDLVQPEEQNTILYMIR